MQFINYEKIIRDSYPEIIESFVHQYGEQYREYITKELENVRYLFYVIPERIVDYVKSKSKNQFMRAILKTYPYNLIDNSKIEIGAEELIVKDKYLANVTNSLFAGYDRSAPIFLFDSDPVPKMDEKSLLMARLKVMQDLGIDCSDVREFVKSGQYATVLERLSKFHHNFRRLYMQECKDDDRPLLRFAVYLEREAKKIGENYINMWLDSPQVKRCGINDLEAYFEDEDSSNYFSCVLFRNGLIDYFGDDYTRLLVNPNTNKETKTRIVEKRLKYLQMRGFDTDKLRVNDLFVNWNKSFKLQKYHSEIKKLQPLIEEKKYLSYRYFDKMFKLFAISDINGIYEITRMQLAKNICDKRVLACAATSSMCPKIVGLNPFVFQYTVFDQIIDHELHHIVAEHKKFRDYDERVVEKLSMESTRERWQKGQFIFNDAFSLLTNYYASSYQRDLDNLAIIFEPLREKLIAAHIDHDDKILETIPLDIMTKIDGCIDEHSDENTEYLHQVADRLTRNDKTKTKKLSFWKK